MEIGENILASLNCNLKSFINFTIVDKNGVLLVTDSKILFCECVGKDLALVHDFEYRLITSFDVKEDYDKKKYIVFKYNGDKVKITNITSGDISKVEEIVKSKQIML